MMRRPKIALVSDAFGHIDTEDSRSITNGTVKFTSLLAQYSPQFGVDMRLLTTSTSYGNIDSSNIVLLEPERMAYAELPPTAQTHGGVAPQAMRAGLNEFQPDVVSLSTLGAPNAEVAQRWAIKHGVPIVATIHTHPGKLVVKAAEELDLARDTITRLRDITRKKILRLSRHLSLAIVRSENSRQDLQKWGLTSDMHVLKGGIDTGMYRPPSSEAEISNIRRKYGLAEDEIIMLFVGRFSPAKESEAILQTYREARKTHPSIRLVIVGNTSYYDDQLADLNAEGVNLLGELRPANVAEVIRAADMGIAPSPHETFGQAIAEMMASELPCVLPNEGGHLAFATSESATLLPVFSEGTARQWVEAVLDLSRCKDTRLAIGQRARTQVPDLIDSFEDFIEAHTPFMPVKRPQRQARSFPPDLLLASLALRV